MYIREQNTIRLNKATKTPDICLPCYLDLQVPANYDGILFSETDRICEFCGKETRTVKYVVDIKEKVNLHKFKNPYLIDAQKLLIRYFQKDLKPKQYEEINKALETMKDHPYFDILEAKYVQKKTDAEVAEEKYCHLNTVVMNRKRLLTKLAVELFGEKANDKKYT